MLPLTSSPSEEYKQRQQARETQVAHFENLHRRFGNLRLLIVVATVVAAWFSLYRDAFSPWWLLTFLALFLTIAILHARVLRQRSCAERAAAFYRNGLARIEDRWTGTGQTGERIDIHSSLYATDLDLFGPGSLFELLSLARTRMGEDTLAAWLLVPSPVADLTQRHVAVAELRTHLDLREDIAVLGEDLKVGIHPEPLTQWAEAPKQLTHPWLRWISLLLALSAIAAAIVWAEFGTKAPFFAILLIETIVTASLRRQTAAILHTTDHALEDLQLLASLLTRIEREHFESPHLQILKTQLSTHDLNASQAISRLKTIVEYIRSLDNPVMRALDIPLLYTVQVAYAAEAWRAAHAVAVRSWLRATGELEALLSLSAYSYEHPADPFPKFVEGPPCFIAEQIGHPLLPAALCIRNDIDICGETRLLLVSGSNMSGKSTLLRTVGINTVLAMAGAPVRAQNLQLTSLQIGASILVNDSLQEGSSRFYAEINRLRHICDLAEHRPPVLFLLDELLQGTNSKDRLIGAEGVVRALLATGAIGLISTHDLALTNLGEQQGNRLHNVHLQDTIVDGKMKFDFKLQEGVVTKSNGIELMRLIGLKV
ncbi:MAG: mismatch repair protein [Edaphobacter sp.]